MQNKKSEDLLKLQINENKIKTSLLCF